MDIAERRKPQDGPQPAQVRRTPDRPPRVHAADRSSREVVIRLLNSDSGIQPLDQIGLFAGHLKTMRKFLSSQGLVLVTGPTGSGKTSTLYTALKSIKSSSNNIITLEIRSSCSCRGVNQTSDQRQGRADITTGLRSILRQDPNVILVGEIRDHETADIALQAAQTGHSC